MRRIVTGFGVLLFAVGLTAGCSAAAKEPVGLTASPTATATATPTSTPNAEAVAGVVRDWSDPALGVVFEAVPAVQGDAADVYNRMASFEKEAWRTTTTNQLSPGLDLVASAEVKADFQSTSDANVKNGNHYGGVIHVRVDGISVNGDTARGTACRDYAKATFSDAAKSYTPEEAGFGKPLLIEVTLAHVNGENVWKVMTAKENGTC
jgi:hypothetical protein